MGRQDDPAEMWPLMGAKVEDCEEESETCCVERSWLPRGVVLGTLLLAVVAVTGYRSRGTAANPVVVEQLDLASSIEKETSSSFSYTEETKASPLTTTTTPTTSPTSTSLTTGAPSSSKVDIVHVVLDDVGMGDLWESSDLPLETVAPRLASLRAESVELVNYYGQAFCTPARAALMTGKFTHRVGFADEDVWGARHFEITAWANFSLAGEHKFLPAYLKDLKYQTFAVGKWNVGHCNARYVPISRGFDRFFGYFGAGLAYTSHLVEASDTSLNKFFDRHGQSYELYDMSECDTSKKNDWGTEGCRVPFESNGTYTTVLFAREALKMIENATLDDPLYLYMAFHGVHDDFDVADISSTFAIEDRFAIEDALKGSAARQNFAFGLKAVDDAIGQLKDAMDLRTHRDYIMVVHSDNGAQPCDGACVGSNAPYRGLKFYDFEGGLKVPGLLYASFMPERRKGSTYNGLMHHVDWLATLLAAAGGSIKNCEDCDSKNHFDAILSDNNDTYAIRDTIAFSITNHYASLRFENFKLLVNRSDAPWYTTNYDDLASTAAVCQQASNYDFLFDLDNDPTETTNLSDDPAYSDIKNKLTSRWQKILREQYQERIHPIGFDLFRSDVIDFFVNSTSNAAKFVVPWGC